MSLSIISLCPTEILSGSSVVTEEQIECFSTSQCCQSCLWQQGRKHCLSCTTCASQLWGTASRSKRETSRLSMGETQLLIVFQAEPLKMWSKETGLDFNRPDSVHVARLCCWGLFPYSLDQKIVRVNNITQEWKLFSVQGWDHKWKGWARFWFYDIRCISLVHFLSSLLWSIFFFFFVIVVILLT